jgi:hypothetical protein
MINEKNKQYRGLNIKNAHNWTAIICTFWLYTRKALKRKEKKKMSLKF